MKSRQNAAAVYLGQITDQDEKFKELVNECEFRQDKLEKEAGTRVEEVRRDAEARVKVLEENVKAAEKTARDERDAWLRKQSDLEAGNAELNAKLNRLSDELLGRNRTLSERDARMEDMMEKMSSHQEEVIRLQETHAADLAARAVEVMRLKEAHAADLAARAEEVARLQEAHAVDLAAKVTDAAARATAPLQGQLLRLEQNLLAQQQRSKEELTLQQQHSKEELAAQQQHSKAELAELRDLFNRNKERMEEELSRRQSYAEVADFKIQEMEAELMKSRQNAAAEHLGQIAGQDDKFRSLAKDYEDRQAKLEKETMARVEELKREYESRLREMDELLRSKDSLMREGGDLWRQKQAELDAQHSSLNTKINAFNGEMFAQRQALSERENTLNAQQLAREKDLAARMSEIQTLKVELTRTIADYKNRK